MRLLWWLLSLYTLTEGPWDRVFASRARVPDRTRHACRIGMALSTARHSTGGAEGSAPSASLARRRGRCVGRARCMAIRSWMSRARCHAAPSPLFPRSVPLSALLWLHLYCTYTFRTLLFCVCACGPLARPLSAYAPHTAQAVHSSPSPWRPCAPACAGMWHVLVAYVVNAAQVPFCTDLFLVRTDLVTWSIDKEALSRKLKPTNLHHPMSLEMASNTTPRGRTHRSQHLSRTPPPLLHVHERARFSDTRACASSLCVCV